MLGELPGQSAYFESVIHPGVEPSLANDQYKVVSYGNSENATKIARAIESGEPVTLEIGMGATMAPTPGLLAYLEMGIQRLKPLADYGFNNVRLRFFSTAGLRMNGEDPEAVIKIQGQQRALFDQYLDRFYPELAAKVDTADICQPLEPPANIDEMIDLMQQYVPSEILSDLEACGENHGGAFGRNNALKYGACHLLAQTFGHSPDKGCRVAIGCQGEHVFNLVRHLMPEEADANPSISLVVQGVLSKTAPYLYREGAIGKLALSRNGYSGPITFAELAEILRFASAESFQWGSTLMDRIKSNFRSHNRWDKIPQILELKYVEEALRQQENGLARFSDFVKQEGVSL